jgi:hypothetical protein
MGPMRGNWSGGDSGPGNLTSQLHLSPGDIGSSPIRSGSPFAGMGGDLGSGARVGYTGRVRSLTNSGGLFRKTSFDFIGPPAPKFRANTATRAARLGRISAGRSGFGSFWKASGQGMGPDWLRMGVGHPLMPAARWAAIGGLGVVGLSSARTAINRAQNRDYSGAAVSAGVAAGTGYLAYHYALGNGSIRNHLRLAARAGTSVGNYLKSLTPKLRI